MLVKKNGFTSHTRGVSITYAVLNIFLEFILYAAWSFLAHESACSAKKQIRANSVEGYGHMGHDAIK